MSSNIEIPDATLLNLQGILDELFDPSTGECQGVNCGPIFFSPFAGSLLRLIFDDCGGPEEDDTTTVSKCDGCIALDAYIHSDLHTRAVQPLEAIYLNPLNGLTIMSRADFWAFAATYAIKYTQQRDEQTDSLPDIPYYFGRKDCSTAPNLNSQNTNIKQFPSNVGDWQETFTWMNTNFGLDAEQTVALFGAHTIGRAHEQDSGFTGSRTAQWGIFDNTYYAQIQQDNLKQEAITTPDDTTLKQWQVVGGSSWRSWINPDIALFRDLSGREEDGTVSCADGSTAANCQENGDTNSFVVSFANDNQAWLNKFVEAYKIMVKAGYPNVAADPDNPKSGELTPVSEDDLYDGKPAIVSGDPHFTTFDDSKHDLQGKPKESGKSQFYYLVSCDVNQKTKIPFSMLGKHTNINSKSKISGLDYIALELFDNNDIKYLVFLSASIRHYVMETDGVSTLYDTNVKNGVSLTKLSSGTSTNIGDRFVILVNTPNSKQIDVTLTIDGYCQLIFIMKAQRKWSGRYRMHYLRVMPPNCYKRYICGVLGDFKQRGFKSQKLAQCNGDLITIKDGMKWKKIYDPDGMSWEKTYVDGYCNGDYEEEEDTEDTECDESIKDEVIATCQKVRDDQHACCRAIGGDFCDFMQTWCEIDACITSEGDATQIISNVYDLFTAEVVETCEDCQGCFGPIPKLLYEFDGNLKETQSDGDDKYKLQTVGDASVANGVLNCDGTGDYAYNEYNLDFSMNSHSLEVLVSLDSLLYIGGGAISIDSTYTSNEPNSGYQHNQFDSIVYNELNDRRWFSGSEGLQRTQTGVGTQEFEIGEYIHLVTIYDVDNDKVKLYRNGIMEQDYTPSGFLEIDKDGGYRIMFCQRHMNAGTNDYIGKIKFGAIYDYALSEEEVEILYKNSMVQVFGHQYEVIGDDLLPDKTLQTGQALRSTNQRYVAVLQRDGNFVVYDLSESTATDAVLFATNTADAVSDETRYLIYQASDGNLVLYRNNPYSGSKYTSDTADNDGTGFLIMENDGNLVIYNGDNVVKWSSNTVNDAKFDFFSLDKWSNYEPKNEPKWSFHQYSYPMYYYFIGIVVLILIMMVNIMICCKNKQLNNTKKGKYKVISLESTDVETDTDIQN